MARVPGGNAERGEGVGAAAGAVVAPAFRCVIPGPPIAQGRPRFTTQGGFPRAYDPWRSRIWKKTAATLMREARGARPMLEGPLELAVVAVSPCPASHHRKKIPRPRTWDSRSRNDWDNIGKACTDAAQGVWFANDGQIARASVERWIAGQSEAPSVTISVRSLEGKP